MATSGKRPERERIRRWRLGKRAEWMAALSLIVRGYRILSWRYKVKAGEIDLIARRGDCVAIVEVKARTSIEAAMDAARLRFRAVLMTAFSFILGVIPLLIATGAGAESRQAMGTTVFGGMLVATIVSLLAVPMLYMVIQWASEKLRGVSNSSPSE